MVVGRMVDGYLERILKGSVSVLIAVAMPTFAKG